MQKYKVISFDLDDTLIDDTQARKYGIEQVAKKVNLPYTEELGNSFVQFDDAFWHRNYDRNVPSFIKEDGATYLRSIRFIDFFKNLSISYEESIQIYYFYRACLEDCIFALDNAYETIKKLYNTGYSIAIATNGVKAVISKKLEIIQILNFISTIVCSEDIHYDKPHPAFFYYLLEKCQCSKEEILHVGNSLSSDIQGGMNSGIDTVWFNPYHKPLSNEYSPTYEIDNLLALTKIL